MPHDKQSITHDTKSTIHDSRFTLRLWWRAVRPFAYPASVVPAILGPVIFWSEGHHVNLVIALLGIIGAVAAHTGANLMNDYWDHKKGVDREGTLGGSGILVEKIAAPRAILIGSVVSYAIAAAIAVPMCFKVGMPLVLLVIAGLIAGAGYVLPPFSLKYRAFGDLTVFGAFGAGVTLGSYMMQSGSFSWTPVFYSVPIGLLVAAILHSNNTRDAGDDCMVNFRTVAGYMGPKLARYFYVALVAGAYLSVVIFAAMGVIDKAAMAVFITLPLAWKNISMVIKAPVESKDSLVMADARTAQLNMAFGVVMMHGIIFGRLFFS